MTTDIPVRLATPGDEPEIMEMCRMLHSENGAFPMDDDLVRSQLQLAFAKKGGMLGVIGEPGHLQGMIYLLIAHFWYSREWHLEELFSWVHPNHRRSNNAKNLIGFAKHCADELKIPLVIGIISNTRTEAKVELYKRQLKKPAGAFFIYGGKWDMQQDSTNGHGR